MGLVKAPPEYPLSAETTPSSFSKSCSKHQKQPPAKIASSDSANTFKGQAINSCRRIEITISFLKVLFIGIIELISPEYPLMLYL